MYRAADLKRGDVVYSMGSWGIVDSDPTPRESVFSEIVYIRRIAGNLPMAKFKVENISGVYKRVVPEDEKA